MAHGNMSDMVFFMLLAITIQWWGFPDTLFQDIGPLKAQFTGKSADMDAMIKFGAGLILTFAMTMSGVSWNKINGKMAGFGAFITAGYTAYSTFKADKDVFVPKFFYIYAAVIFLGALHIFLFPSNPMPPKTPEVKNNHGNTSDLVALSLIALSLACLFYPEHLFYDLGPIKAQFSRKSAQSTDLQAIVKFVGCLMLTLALTFSGVKWNPINGKMAGLGAFIGSGYTAYSTFKADSDAFVLRMFYIYAAVLFLGALHIFVFPSNPLAKKEGKTD